MKLKMIHAFSTKPIIFASLLLFGQALLAYEFHVIKDPKPTVSESIVTYLEEVRTIPDDFGNDQILFAPYSLAADKNDIFVYEKMQSKIFHFSPDFKLLGTFGRKGQGPGEFNKAGRLSSVVLELGRDGNLYANDRPGYKLMGFTREGKSTKTYSYGRNFYNGKPVADKEGNIITVLSKDDNLEIINENMVVVASFKSKKIHHGYLLEDPGKLNRSTYENSTVVPYAVWTQTIDGNLLIFFGASSTLAVFNGKKYMKTLKLWPREALKQFKEKYRQLKQRKRNIKFKNIRSGGVFIQMFYYPIVDQDNKDIFYLQKYHPDEKIATSLYAFNLSGQLLKVIHIPVNPDVEGSKFVLINAKVNNIFYAIRGSSSNIVLFKEKKK